ncbi:MAG TPA: 50S ribosomal protein L5 [Candidatus Saccharimonadales bacterium]|nr:50S ribosomal protein L5 [Candidatus Saccharimonadales bacterium]
MVVKEKYDSQVKKSLKQDFSLKNDLAIPKVEKVVLNVGFGAVSADEKMREQIVNNLNKISGQKPAERKAKKAIASFKIRQGQPIGAQVTLRGKKMYYFLDKLTAVVLPRVRDFRGVSETSFDGRGNYSLGFKEVNVFPEIDYQKGEKSFGLEVTITTSAKDDQVGKALLTGIGIPFRKVEN